MIAAVVDCQVCPVGTDCDEIGATLEALPLLPGYFRLDMTTDDVQTCPDARANCCHGTRGVDRVEVSFRRTRPLDPFDEPPGPRHDGGPDPQETGKHVARGPMDAGRRIRAR